MSDVREENTIVTSRSRAKRLARDILAPIFMTLTFWGAAQVVTGSMHIVELNGNRYVLDCGLFQGRRAEANQRNKHLPFPGSTVSSVLLSHAHIDHSGNLPSLGKSGFSGQIHTTPATVDLCRAMLLDSAHLQESDAAYLNKRAERRRRFDPLHQPPPVEPLYSEEDVHRILPQFHGVPLHTRFDVGPGLTYQTFEAGHMLGSTCILLEMEEQNRRVKLLFSGDVGRANLPIIPDPETAPQADYLIMESTYGDRLHKELGPVSDRLAKIISNTHRRGGKIIVPAFAVGRTQQLILLLHTLIDEGKIPSMPMYVDSPLAVNVTDVFRAHRESVDAETRAFFDRGDEPFAFQRLRYIRDVAESKELNEMSGPFLVISASGMCEAGRVLHHLKHAVSDPRNLILITGYQAENTLGRRIVEDEPVVRIFGQPYELKAQVVALQELSGHADQHELLEWMKPLARSVKGVFLVHGEPPAQKALALAIRERYGLKVETPVQGQKFDLL